MKKSYSVEKTFSGMRLDRWIRNIIKKIPQSLIEKNLRKGKIKLNGEKVKILFWYSNGQLGADVIKNENGDIIGNCWDRNGYDCICEVGLGEACES